MPGTKLLLSISNGEVICEAANKENIEIYVVDWDRLRLERAESQKELLVAEVKQDFRHPAELVTKNFSNYIADYIDQNL